MIPYARQDVTESDIQAVVAALKSEYLTQGPAPLLFETTVAEKSRAKYAVSMNSATSALHLACLALGVGPGDCVWTVPNTFVASANCALYCGADVDFVDIDPLTWNMSAEKLRTKLLDARRTGRLPKVVVPVHFGGQAPPQEEMFELGLEFGFQIVEDASHAIGAARQGEPVGSCRWSAITIFSFHPVKIITTGEGGMALTNDAQLARYMRDGRSHGITRDTERLLMPPPGPWYYEQQALGYNYRMTDIQAALGLSQLARLDELVDRRNELALRYDSALGDLPLQLPSVDPANRSAFHLYVVRLPASGVAQRGAVFGELRRRGIGVNVHYIPVHLQPYYAARGFKAGYCPEAEAHGAEALTLPLYPALSEKDQDYVIQAVRDCLT